MSNSDDSNTENSSSNSPSPGPSSVASPTNECTSSLKNTIEAISKNFLNRFLKSKASTCETQNENDNVIRNGEVNSSTNLNAAEISGNSDNTLNRGVCSGVERTSNSTTGNDNNSNNNENAVTPRILQVNHDVQLEDQANTVCNNNNINIENKVVKRVENQEATNDFNNQTDHLNGQSQNENQNQNTNRNTRQERNTEINSVIASFPLEPCQNPSFNTNPTSYSNSTALTTAQRCYQAESEYMEPNMEVTISPPPVPPRIIQAPPPLAGAPPSYSAVMRLGPPEYFPRSCRERPLIQIQPSAPFIAPFPPPSYAEVQGYAMDRPMLVSSVDQMIWGPDPLSIVCPCCANVVVTTIQSQRSNLTHFSALGLCLCGCWPCCLLPYCMDSCKNTYHHCPSCHQFLGMYRPW